MIEVPYVHFLATEFARVVNFFRLGTNDLIQYLFAADRSVTQLARYYRPSDKAVVGAIRMMVTAAHKAHIPIGMCGEMAGDVALTPLLVGLGLRELSVSPSLIPILKACVSNLSAKDCESEYIEKSENTC
jgi:phosphotransferase system enzyme I (PtsI)